MSKNHIGGGKTTGSHTTFIDAAENVVKFLARCFCVKKYSLGIITPARSKSKRIKITDCQGGIKLIVYGNAYIQELFVYSDEVGKLKEELRSKLEKEFIIQ